MTIDLHTHSSHSDGTGSPAMVAAQAADAGLTAFALTDHDTTAGWRAAGDAAVARGVAFVPGMEITCQAPGRISVHLLSYLHDPTDPDLLATVEASRASRLTRAERMVDLLAEDYPIDWPTVQRFVAPGSTVGRPHIADALVDAGIVQTRSEAFDRMLHPRAGYYVGHHAPDPAHVVELVRRAGGVPVFAHPLASERGRVVAEDVFDAMVDAGLAGLEVDHRDNPPSSRRWLREYADRHGLLVTGSSDYHGDGKPNRLGEHTTDPAVLAAIEEQAASGVSIRRP
ncbi:metal-dependent phosphoesterase [Tersicoccus solisilvae]|uniref:Metal-dependent phosphoesterase n=1 Tax=Tersicoccus solisilvae TaxID=1882339 RepID=A0ABQ1P388_9MICC|nr:phosphatase [Tersicoccus solisilvae]GGC88061.1 metal-dependent phosphoesterase [Tersicoccus solisilvae]